MPAALSQLSGPSWDLPSEWALAVVLRTMSDSALIGFSTHRTQAVVDHLRMAAGNPSISMELRIVCAKLSNFWQTIDLQ